MNYRITTSEKTKDRLLKMKSATNLTPNILCRFGIAFSLKNQEPIVLKELLAKGNGLDLNRNVITGRYDQLYKSLISQRERRHLSDEEYFENYLLAHIERGVAELYAEFEMAGNTEKFIKRIAKYGYGRDIA